MSLGELQKKHTGVPTEARATLAPFGLRITQPQIWPARRSAHGLRRGVGKATEAYPREEKGLHLPAAAYLTAGNGELRPAGSPMQVPWAREIGGSRFETAAPDHPSGLRMTRPRT